MSQTKFCLQQQQNNFYPQQNSLQQQRSQTCHSSQTRDAPHTHTLPLNHTGTMQREARHFAPIQYAQKAKQIQTERITTLAGSQPSSSIEMPEKSVPDFLRQKIETIRNIQQNKMMSQAATSQQRNMNPQRPLHDSGRKCTAQPEVKDNQQEQMQTSCSGPSRDNVQAGKIDPFPERAQGDTDTVEYPTAPIPAEGFPPGWTRRTYMRKTGNSAGKTYFHWFSPKQSKTFRSTLEVLRFIDLLNGQANGDENTAWNLFKSKCNTRRKGKSDKQSKDKKTGDVSLKVAVCIDQKSQTVQEQSAAPNLVPEINEEVPKEQVTPTNQIKDQNISNFPSSNAKIDDTIATLAAPLFRISKEKKTSEPIIENNANASASNSGTHMIAHQHQNYSDFHKAPCQKGDQRSVKNQQERTPSATEEQRVPLSSAIDTPKLCSPTMDGISKDQTDTKSCGKSLKRKLCDIHGSATEDTHDTCVSNTKNQIVFDLADPEMKTISIPDYIDLFTGSTETPDEILSTKPIEIEKKSRDSNRIFLV
eukprot:CAMPEP_0195524360 /NCGR_PEP_ID=MMETSP0794_2-20130614/24146_1 /TAXON_ID=515487 /ORGANISM="Stephanopyxis turris, Strain CCMP 815" /LENGTH=531 /DNA_ID=CAMNT_0040654563 /DNA_START=220 /DNA_END=1815 /DNA_ORIENTATION=-